MVIAAGPLVNLVLALLLFVVFFWVIGATTQSDRVGQIEEGFPAATALKPGDRLVAVDGERGSIAQLEAISEHKCPERPPVEDARRPPPRCSPSSATASG